MYLHRDIEKVLKTQIKSFSAIAVTGPRQTGKSTLLRNLFGKDYKYISFDDPLTRETALSDPELFLDRAGDYLILDEIQYATPLIPYLKMQIDADRQKKGKYILTGSQQFQMMKSLTESLAGRIALFQLLPFSVFEFPGNIAKGKNNYKTRDSFETFCLKSAFPEPLLTKGLDYEVWLGAYIQTYLERDIRSIHNIGSLREFLQFMRLAASRCSQVLNLNEISREIGVSFNTIKNWLSALEASNVIYLLSPYYKNMGKRITKNPKIYFTDIGLVCYLTGIKTKDLIFDSNMGGALFENFIIQETLKMFYNKGKRPSVFYLRTHNGVEVDLLVEKNTELFPFEIKLTKTPTVTMGKNLEQFRNLFEKLEPQNGKIICLCSDNLTLTKTVSACSVPDFLKWISD